MDIIFISLFAGLLVALVFLQFTSDINITEKMIGSGVFLMGMLMSALLLATWPSIVGINLIVTHENVWIPDTSEMSITDTGQRMKTESFLQACEIKFTHNVRYTARSPDPHVKIFPSACDMLSELEQKDVSDIITRLEGNRNDFY